VVLIVLLLLNVNHCWFELVCDGAIQSLCSYCLAMLRSQFGYDEMREILVRGKYIH
jgi:hypothetical protein